MEALQRLRQLLERKPVNDLVYPTLDEFIFGFRTHEGKQRIIQYRFEVIKKRLRSRDSQAEGKYWEIKEEPPKEIRVYVTDKPDELFTNERNVVLDLPVNFNFLKFIAKYGYVMKSDFELAESLDPDNDSNYDFVRTDRLYTPGTVVGEQRTPAGLIELEPDQRRPHIEERETVVSGYAVDHTDFVFALIARCKIKEALDRIVRDENLSQEERRLPFEAELEPLYEALRRMPNYLIERFS